MINRPSRDKRLDEFPAAGRGTAQQPFLLGQVLLDDAVYDAVEATSEHGEQRLQHGFRVAVADLVEQQIGPQALRLAEAEHDSLEWNLAGRREADDVALILSKLGGTWLADELL